MKGPSHYELLGLHAAFTEEELRTAWRKAVMRWHPDVNKSPRGAEFFKKALVAYQTLRSPQTRRAYDQELEREQIAIPRSAARSAAPEGGRSPKMPFRLRHLANEWRLRFSRFPYPEGYRAPKIDPLVRRLPREELRHRILHSRNPFVQSTAATALRARGEYELLFDAAHHAEGPILRELLRCFRGLSLRRAWPALLHLYETHRGNMDRDSHREFQELLDSLGRDFTHWLLTRSLRQKALPGAAAAETLLARYGT
ncbi:MAG: J domain-containing protein [Spirochaetes bacterium]|nr:J domain-containing protein [Spirochaetota bacterium]